MLAALDAALGHGQRVSRRTGSPGQASIFDGGFGEAEAAVERHHPPIPTTEFDERELLRLEKETLGLYVSEHPLERVQSRAPAEDRLRARRSRTPTRRRDRHRRRHRLRPQAGDDEARRPDGVRHARRPDGSAEVVVFNSTYAAARELLEADRILVVKGRVDHKQAGETKLVAMRGQRRSRRRSVRREVRLRIDARQAPAGLIRELAALVPDYPGDAPVYVALETSLGERTLALGPEYRVKPDADFFAEVKALLGEAALV